MIRHVQTKGTRVKNGRVLPARKLAPTPNYDNTPQEWPFIDRRKPGKGFRHVITVAEMRRFLELLPDWREISKGLNAIVLAAGDVDCMGWHRAGVVAVCAWPRDMIQRWDSEFVSEHESILDRLGVARARENQCLTHCDFNESTARGFSLMHIFLHELGHHHDRMSTRGQLDSARGEDYAEEYALRYSEQIWDAYFDSFGWD
jgi:hypothetical protein